MRPRTCATWLLVILLGSILLAACAPAAPAPTMAPAPAATTAPAPKPTTAPAPTTAAAPAATTAPAPAATTAPAPAAKRTLRVGSARDIVSLNPAQAALTTDRMMMSMVYSGLVRADYSSMKVIPDVAEKWTVSPDGKTYTFNLRKGVQFHKGYGELTSADVKYTIAYHQNKDNKSRAANLLEVVEEVATPDPYTAILKLKQPYVGFITILAWQNGFILSEKATKALGDKLSSEPVGSGPFEFTSWKKGQEVLFTRFDKYFGDKPMMDEVLVKVIPDENTQVLAIQRGELDAAPVTRLDGLRTAKGGRGVKVLAQPSSWIIIGIFNAKTGPTSNPRLRQALVHAFDTSGFKEMSDGVLEPTPNFLNRFGFGYSADVPTYPYDPAKAKAMLAEAGYKGETLKIMYEKVQMREEMAIILKDAWAKVGVNAQLDMQDAATSLSNAAAGKFDLFVTTVTRNHSDEYLSGYVRTGGPANYGGYSNADVDRLMVEARSQADEGKAKALYAELQKKLYTDIPIIPVSLQQGTWAVNEKVLAVPHDAYYYIVDWTRVKLAN